MSIFKDVSWVKAGTLSVLTGLSVSDVIVSRFRPAVVHPAFCAANEKPFAYHAAEDRAYWGQKFGRELSQAEHLEVQVNLVRFAELLIAQARRTKLVATGARLQ